MARYRSETHPRNRHRDRRLNHSRQRRPQTLFLHLATLSSTHPNSTRQKLGTHRRLYRDLLQFAHADWMRFGLSARAAAAHALLLLSLLRSGTWVPLHSTEQGPNGACARGHWLERNSFRGDDLHYLADLRKNRRLSHTSTTTHTGGHQLRIVAVIHREGGLSARRQRQILGNGGGRMVHRKKQSDLYLAYLCCARAPRHIRTQVKAAKNRRWRYQRVAPLSTVRCVRRIPHGRATRRAKTRFPPARMRNTTWTICSYIPLRTTITVRCYSHTCST